MVLFAYILLGIFLLIGLVYLVTEADLTEKPRLWFTSAVIDSVQTIPGDLESDNDTVELPPVQTTITTPGETHVQSDSEKLAETQTPNGLEAQLIKTDILTQIAVEACVTVSKDAKPTMVMPILPQPEGTATVTPPSDVVLPTIKAPRRLVRRFVGRVVSCAFCTAGWVSLPAAGLVVCEAVALHYHLWGLAIPLAVLMVPPTGIGVMWTLDRLSPLRASDRVVDAAIDVAAAVMEQQRGKH